MACYDKHGLVYEPEEIIPNLNLQPTFDEMAKELCECVSCPTKSVLVTDVVDVNSLASDGAGAFMSEMLKSSLNRVCKYTITEAKFREYFQLDSNGFVALSNSAKDIKEIKKPVSTAIVSTYKYSPSKLHIFTKEINIRTGDTRKISTREVPFTCMGSSIIRTDF